MVTESLEPVTKHDTAEVIKHGLVDWSWLAELLLALVA